MNTLLQKLAPSNTPKLHLAQAKIIQPKLYINSPGDKYEQEADAMADKVMRMPANGTDFKPKTGIIGASVQRKCAACEEEEKQRKIMRKETGGLGGSPVSNAFSSTLNSTKGGGSYLPQSTRGFMENAFSTDFSNVRIHNDSQANQLSRDINAKAFTHGNDIYFGAGQYAPNTYSGKSLLAHELTHTVQQEISIEKKIQRAVTILNGQTINIDYGNIIFETNYLLGAQTAITTFIGGPPSALMNLSLGSLTSIQQKWLLFAIDLLNDNTTSAHAGLNRTEAVTKLIQFAPISSTPPLPNFQDFVREVMMNSGWLDTALTIGLTAPTTTDQAVIDNIINPPATGGASPGPLDIPLLQSRLIPALTFLLNQRDPALITNVGRQSIGNIQNIGNDILTEARSFFSPMADASSNSVFNINPAWVASANISDTTTQTPDQGDRLNYLANRAQIVGRSDAISPVINDPNIFADTNFDGTRTRDRQALFTIISGMESNSTIRPIVNRLILHTGFQTGSGSSTHIGINPEFNATTTNDCVARWRTIDTLCHEVLHALSHPNFENASNSISFPQVVREGFTEVLGNQLFNDRVIPKAASNSVFKLSLEAGVPTIPCGPPAAGTIGYQNAGSGAETIRQTVGDQNFRAAYFLGRKDLVGM